jgi:DDE family transposase
MFRPRRLDPSADRADVALSAFQRRRLAGSWVYPFRDQVLPLIDEHAFADFFHAGFGAPNRSISLVIGILLLKDCFDLTDQEALEHFAFDRRWHIALDVLEEEVSCCQKTLHNFRALLRQHDKARSLFEQLSRQLVDLLGIDTRRQRLDSTHCQSNVAPLKRLGIFCETIRLFLRRLRRCLAADDFASLPEQLRQRYHTEAGHKTRYDGTSTDIARRRLSVVARDLFRLVQRFEQHPGIASWPEFAALRRVLAEQCEVLPQPQQPQADDDDVALGPLPVRVRAPKEVPSSSLQTPHDPDVTYGKKGQGYEVQVCETFGNKSEEEPGKPELLTHIEVTPSCQNDVNVTVPIIRGLKERGMQPKQLEVDGNFTSSDVVEQAGKLGTDLNGPVKGNKDLPKPLEVTLAEFRVDAEQPQNSRCPAGQPLSKQTIEATGRISLAVIATVCAACGVSSACPAKPGKAEQRGERVVKTTQEEMSCARRRRYETTKEFRERQAWRAGIEATNSELKRKHGLGKLPVRGLGRVRVAVYLKGLACNVKRVVTYLGKRPLAHRSQREPRREAAPPSDAASHPRSREARLVANPGS